MQTCIKCKKELPFSEFYKSTRNKSGYRSSCIKCYNLASSLYDREHKTEKQARGKKYWQENKQKIMAYREAHKEERREKLRLYNIKNRDKRRDYDLKIKYNISLEGYNKLFQEQEGKCAICQEVGKLVVDHDHDTGQTRGLLCNNCNTAIGLLKDKEVNLYGAIKYLNIYKITS